MLNLLNIHRKATEVESYEDYKAYLQADIELNRHLKGYQTHLAKAAGCHPSFVSQVLNSSIHLTPDHAARICEFWTFTQAETEYFLALVNFARAATPALRLTLQKSLLEFRKQKSNLAKRFQQPKLEGIEAEALYYSSWVYVAVHVLASIPAFQEEEAIAKRLNLSVSKVKTVLKKLAEMGLVAQTGKSWNVANHSIHLPKESSLLAAHLQSWRQRAVLSTIETDSSNIHYSAIHALSRTDIEKLRHMVFQFLENSRQIVTPSPEEEMICINLDFFIP